ncbi:MAG: hypothetical protein V4714_03850 [Bacteroidota bacterium]
MAGVLTSHPVGLVRTPATGKEAFLVPVAAAVRLCVLAGLVDSFYVVLGV